MLVANHQEFYRLQGLIREKLQRGDLLLPESPMGLDVLEPWTWGELYSQCWHNTIRQIHPPSEFEMIEDPIAFLAQKRRVEAERQDLEAFVLAWEQCAAAEKVRASGIVLPEQYPGHVLDPRSHPGYGPRPWGLARGLSGWCSHVMHGRYALGPLGCACGAPVASWDDGSAAALCLICYRRLLEAQEAVDTLHPMFRSGTRFDHPDSAQYVQHIPALKAWAREPHGMFYVFGIPGTGKTSAAISTLRWAAWHGWSVKFVEYDMLLKAYTRDSPITTTDRKNTLFQIEEATLLVVDDFAMNASPEFMLAPVRDMIVHRAQKRLGTIMTSNVKPEDLSRRIPEAFVSRIYGITGTPARMLEFHGQDLRRRGH